MTDTIPTISTMTRISADNRENHGHSGLKKIRSRAAKKLEIYKKKGPAALALYDNLEHLISAAERGEITTPVEPRDIPGSKIMDESNLREYQDLSEAYSTFYIELIGVRGSESYKMMEEMIKEARRQK